MDTKPPNILFLLPDQHRPDWLGTNPDLPIRTPNIDRLAARGIRFTQAFCASPLCAPSRATLASGRDYDRCGVINNGQNYPLDQPTYYQALRDRGYRVGGVGKFDLHKATLDWGINGSRGLSDWGFTDGIDNEGKFDGSRSYLNNGRRPRGPYLAYLAERGLADAYAAEHAPEIRRPLLDAYTTCLDDEAYCDNWVAENGLDLLRRFPKNQPWHLVVNFTGPHNPMDVTDSMRERWAGVDFPPPHANHEPDQAGILRNHQNYAAMIENIDRQVGRFIDLVRERGELDNSLIVYASDHGEMLGDHERWGKSIWQTPSIGVPLIISGPGIAPGRINDALICLHDLAATFIDLAGATPMPEMDARSLRPLLEGSTTSHRAHIVSGLDDWRLVYDGRYKLVVGWEESPMLFDMVEDPWEDVDIAVDEPAIVARLAALMEA